MNYTNFTSWKIKKLSETFLKNGGTRFWCDVTM